jgi:hypothetical protein
MNTIFKKSIFCLSLGILLTVGCKKDGSNPSPKMNATIDGKSWNSSVRVTVKNNDGFIITGTQVNTSFVTSTLVVKIFGFAPGTYNVIATSSNCAAIYTPNIQEASNSFASVTGTVSLTEVNTSNKTISGTYSFTCTNLSLQLTTIANGSFNDLIYTESSGN